MLLFYNDFEKAQLKVHLNELPVVSIVADEKAVNRIVINIIQNVLRYAKTYFTIEMVEEEMYIRLSAVNDMDEFNHAEIRHIFDHSFRIDTSRTSDQLGLGLHIRGKSRLKCMKMNLKLMYSLRGGRKYRNDQM